MKGDADMEQTNAKTDIELLAKLLNAEKSGIKDVFSDSRNEFYTVLEREYREALYKSSFPQQENIYSEIREILDGMELFSYIPELLGKTLIGVFGFESELTKRGLDYLLGDGSSKLVRKDSNIPCVFVNKGKEIVVANDAWNQFDLSQDEFNHTNKSLWRYDIDICRFLRTFTLPKEDRFSHIALIYFPPYIQINELFNRMLLQKIDAAVIWSPASLKDLGLWIPLKQLFHTRRIPCHIIAEALNEELRWEAETPNVYVTTEGGFIPIFEHLNLPRDNSTISDVLEIPLLKVRRFYEDSLREIEENQKLLTNDLTYITVDSTKETVRELVAQTRGKKEQLETEQRILQQGATELRAKAKIYEDALKQRVYASCQGMNVQVTQFTLDTWSRMFFQLVDMGDSQGAWRYLQKIKKSGYSLSYIYDMIVQSIKGESIPAHAIDRLCKEIDTEFVRKAKIRLDGVLPFAEIDYMRIARDINFLDTAKEFYYRARWEESENKLKDAVKFYKLALKAGSPLAGQRLLELSKKTSGISLQMLSDEMIPEANYALGLSFQQEKKYAKSNRYFKLAAAKGHIPSIKILTDGIFFGIMKRSKEGLSSKDKDTASNVIRLYQYILEKNDNDQDSKEKIGDLYNALGDTRRALDYWRQCNTATSNYHCGRLFQYPEGSIGQDLDAALKFFKKAADLGHEKARAEYNKVLSWKEQNRVRQIKQEQRSSYTPRVVESPRKKESSGCFITSAVCTALKKPDDCEELMLLRTYRDQIKQASESTSRLIAEYYRVAPKIVDCIDQDPQSGKIYQDLWDNDIAETCNLVRNGNHAEATRRYIEMTVGLCKKYDVSLSPDISKIIGAICASCK